MIVMERTNHNIDCAEISWEATGTCHNVEKVVNSLLAKHIGDIPVLDIGEKRGITGYIDFLKKEDLSAPIMRGVDKWGRPFVAIRMKVVNKHESSYHMVETLFQRYSDRTDIWTSGGRYSIIADSSITYEDLRYLERLLKGEPVGIRRYNYEEKQDEEIGSVTIE